MSAQAPSEPGLYFVKVDSKHYNAIAHVWGEAPYLNLSSIAPMADLMVGTEDKRARTMSDKLPPPVTVEHEYLTAILLELQAANELLAALLAQGEPPVTEGPAGTVALREPESKRRIKRS